MERLLWERLETWNPWWGGHLPIELVGVRREVLPHVLEWVGSHWVKVFLGPRRAGKTTVMYQVIDALLKSGVKNILYISFHDPVLREAGLEKLLDLYRKEVGKERMYVFLDEVQEVEGWEPIVRGMLDRKEEVEFFITSSSSIDKTRYAHYLTGRKKTFHIYPFSFREVVGSLSGPIERLQEVYFHWGGFPEVLFFPQKRADLLQEYGEDIIERDVVGKRGFDRLKVEKVFRWLLENPARLVSFSRMERVLGISAESVERYVRALVEAHVFIESYLATSSVGKQVTQRRKYYPIDNGLVWASSQWREEKRGHLLESLVAQELVKAGIRDIHYKVERGETDIYIPSLRLAIHVTFQPSLERERKRGLVVSWDSFPAFALRTVPRLAEKLKNPSKDS